MDKAEKRGSRSAEEIQRERVLRQAKKLSSLSLKYDELSEVIGTPPDIARQNPTKRLVDLMSDEDVIAWLNGKKKTLEGLKRMKKEGKLIRGMEELIPFNKEELVAAIRFLRKEKRLPKGFKG